MPAQAEEVEAAEREGVAIRTGWIATEVVGRDAAVAGVRVQEQAPTGEIDHGRAVWGPVPGSEAVIACDAILVAVGEEPDPSILPEGAGIEISAFAGIVADPRSLQTGRAGVFAGGDVVSGPKTIIDAVAAGRRAAGAMHEFLSGTRNGEAAIMAAVGIPRSPEQVVHLDLSGRPRPTRRSRSSTRSFATTQAGFDEAHARQEASRCFRCDAVYRLPVGPGRGRARAGSAAVPDGVGAARRDIRDRPDRIGRCRVGRDRFPIDRRHPMTLDQVSGLFDAGEGFVEGTIAAALVMLWLLVLALHLGRPYMVRTVRKFTLRLGADLWWIIYVALRDLLLVQVFLGSFIFFYPDVVLGRDLPITGGLAADCAFAVLLIKLMTRGDADTRWFRIQTLLLGLGSVLYIGPYLLGVQVTTVGGDVAGTMSSIFVTSQNTDWSMALCYVSGALAGLMGLVAVIYNLRMASPRPRSQRTEEVRVMSADDLANALVSGGSAWLVFSLAAVLPILWTFTMIVWFARPYVLRFLGRPDPALRRRRVVALVRAHARRAARRDPGPQRRLPHAEPVPRARPAAHRTARGGAPVLGPRREADP